jgi:hypothetical protein
MAVISLSMAFMISRMTSPDRSTDLAGFGRNRFVNCREKSHTRKRSGDLSDEDDQAAGN